MPPRAEARARPPPDDALGVAPGQTMYFLAAAFVAGCLYNLRDAVPPVLMLVVCAILGLMATHPAPPAESFEPYFKNWFTSDYMPRFGKHYRDYLKRKASRENIIKAAGLTLERWFNKATEDLNSIILYETIVKRCLPQAIRINVQQYFRIVAVDLGSADQPMKFVFVGMMGSWFKLPICFDRNWTPLLDPVAMFDGGILTFE